MDLNWCLLICDLLVSVLTLICNLMGLKPELVNSITPPLKFVETRAASQIITWWRWWASAAQAGVNTFEPFSTIPLSLQLAKTPPTFSLASQPYPIFPLSLAKFRGCTFLFPYPGLKNHSFHGAGSRNFKQRATFSARTRWSCCRCIRQWGLAAC